MFDAADQLVKEMKDLYGVRILLKRENLKGGVYFIQLTQDGNCYQNIK